MMSLPQYTKYDKYIDRYSIYYQWYNIWNRVNALLYDKTIKGVNIIFNINKN